MNLVVVSLIAVVAIGTAAGARSTHAVTASSTPSRAIHTGLTLAPGQAGTLYPVRGFHYGALGRFLASCSRSGIARTSYVVAKETPDELVAVDGRGSAGGARLLSGQLRGGSAPSGIEHWIMGTGGEPEEVRVDAFLVAISARSALGYCEFGLGGRLEILLH